MLPILTCITSVGHVSMPRVGNLKRSLVWRITHVEFTCVAMISLEI